MLPIEIKYRNLTQSTITRDFRSFIQAYQPKEAVVITKNWIDVKKIDNTEVSFIPLEQLKKLFTIIEKI